MNDCFLVFCYINMMCFFYFICVILLVVNSLIFCYRVDIFKFVLFYFLNFKLVGSFLELF